MLGRTFMKVLIVSLAVLMALATTEVMAQAYPPQSCAFGSSGYTINIVEPFPLMISSLGPDFTEYPCYKAAGVPCDFPYFVYAYMITPESNISKISQLLPVCRDSIGLLASVPAMYTLLPTGTSETYGSKAWPVGIYDGQVMTWTANPSSGKLYIATKTAAVDINSMALKSGNNFNYCTGGIAGPGCTCGDAPASMLPGNVVEEKRFGPYCIKVERDYVTWCAKKVTDCVTGEEILPVDVLVDGQYLIQCGEASGNQRCMECYIYSEASPGCITYSSGGVTYKIPKGCI